MLIGTIGNVLLAGGLYLLGAAAAGAVASSPWLAFLVGVVSVFLYMMLALKWIVGTTYPDGSRIVFVSADDIGGGEKSESIELGGIEAELRKIGLK